MSPFAAPSPSGPRRRSLPARLLALVLRPTAPPMALGIAVAVAFITAETLLVHVLRRMAPENAFGALFLLGVLVVSAGWGMWLAVATSVTSAVAYVYFHMETNGAMLPAHTQDAVAIAIFLPVALLTNVLVGQARLRAAEAEQRRHEADRAARSARAAQREIAVSHAEALTNAAKHAAATVVEVAASVEGDALHLAIRDDGVGGATAGAGSGLIGLKDRVEALAGRLDITSAPGAGTTLVAHIPLSCG